MLLIVFIGTNLDFLVINNFILKKNQKVVLKHNYKNKYELD